MPILVTTEVQIARFANALYGIKLGSNTNTAVEEDVTNLGLAATVNAYYNYSFGSKTSAEVANIILGNVGLAGNAAAEAFIIGQLNAAGTAKGQAVLSMLNAFANLTSDATFGAAATAWNTTVASALVYTASNTEDVATNATTIQTYVLQTGVEVLVRTSGDDIILAPHNSMDSFDVTDGGAGFDTLVIEGEDYGTNVGSDVSKGAFTNIEKVILNSYDSNYRTLDADNFQGVQQIWLEDSVDFSLEADDLTNAITFGLKGENYAELNLGYKSTATTSNINLDTLNGQALISVDGKGITTVNLSGNVVTTGGLPLNANGETGVSIAAVGGTTKLTTLNVQTSDAIAFDVSTISSLNKIDASTSTGNVFSIIGLKDVGGNGANNGVTYLGAAGTDYVEANLKDLDSKDVLKGNAGYDTFLFNIDYNDNEVDDTESLFDENYQTTWDGDYAPTTAQYALINKVDFEQINFNGQNVDGDWLILDAAKLTAVNIGTEEDTVVLNLENNDTVYYTNTESDNKIDLLAKRDDISPTKYAAGAGTVNLVAATKGVEVEVSPNMKQDGDLGDDDFSDFNKMVVSGAGDVYMDNTEGFGVEIDASGLKGYLDFVAAYDAVDKVTLGAGKDVVHLFAEVDTQANDHDLDLSEGGDWYYDALSDYGNMDTVTGFTSGQDHFVINDIVDDGKMKYLSYTGDLGVDFSQTVALALMAASDAGADVASFVWSGNTYVVQDVFTPSVDWTGDFEPADDIVVKLTGVVSLASTDFTDYYA